MENTTASPGIAGLVEDTPASAGPANQFADRKPHVLIVDDSLTVRMDLRRIFEAGEFRSERRLGGRYAGQCGPGQPVCRPQAPRSDRRRQPDGEDGSAPHI